MLVIQNVVIKTPLAEEWQMFECEKEDYNSSETYYTEETYLPKIMKDLGMVKSTSEVRRNRKELCINLDHYDYMEVKWGKHRLYILVGV